jgi:hypothetical protein
VSKKSQIYIFFTILQKKADSEPIAPTVQRQLDPTAMTPSHNTKSKSGYSNHRLIFFFFYYFNHNPSIIEKITGTAPVSRRVQIFNSSDSFSPDESRQLAVFAKPETSKNFLFEALSTHYLFEALGPEDMTRIIDCMRPTFAAFGEVIIKQGDSGDLFFCLETGTAVATVNDKEVFTYEPSGCFGELALIYNSPRAASVTAKSACKLWALDLK